MRDGAHDDVTQPYMIIGAMPTPCSVMCDGAQPCVTMLSHA